jgi:hydrogenase/urease accessory protein HupE
MQSVNSKFLATTAGVLLAGIALPAFAHEGHGNTVLHAFLHLLQELDHLILLGVAAVAVFAAWRFFKGAKK